MEYDIVLIQLRSQIDGIMHQIKTKKEEITISEAVLKDVKSDLKLRQIALMDFRYEARRVEREISNLEDSMNAL